jgi:oxaloacetate decarboxylase (Na+ extruding) subunit gamma
MPMVAQLLLEAANLMFIGMVAVFSFLLLLVFIVKLISVVMQRYYPIKTTDKAVRIETGSSGPSPAVIAAISSAIHQYRQQQ